MDIIKDFFGNYILICGIVAYFTAQIIKIIITAVRERRIDIGLIFASGGMPSSHSSTTAAMTIAIARTEGVGSVYFAIAAIITSIVMYDAAGVRRAAGEQAKLINRLVDELLAGNTEFASASLKELIGHTPLQVAIGALLGIMIPFILPL